MATALVNVVAPGQCRLVVDSTTQLSLQRHKGMYIPVKVGSDWLAAVIPSTAPTLANTGLTAATLYYIYAADISTVLTLEASTTVHATDADTGVEIKSGDATRTLVGMVFTDAGTPGTFVDSVTKRWCLNWFNRRRLDVQGTISANRNVGGFNFTEIHTEIRAAFLAWADEAVHASISGSIANNNAGAMEALVGVAFDGTTPEACFGFRPVGNGSFTDHLGFSAAVWKTLSEGSHYATMVTAGDSNPLQFFTADAASSARAKSWVRASTQG
jgi:hypothetical protein